MSRIGKQPIPVPAGVTVTIEGNTITTKGAKGELSYEFNPMMSVAQEGEELIVSRPDDSREAKALHGLTRSLIHNMVVGCHDGFEKKLELVGVGYRAALKGSNLELQLGYSHPVVVEAPEGITFIVPDKQAVGQTAAVIRKWRAPEPYKGKGIRYEGEQVRRKLGKAAKSDK